VAHSRKTPMMYASAALGLGLGRATVRRARSRAPAEHATPCRITRDKSRPARRCSSIAAT
jgi:hypothetical protein